MTPSMTPVTSSPTPKSCTCQKARKEIGWETSPQVIRSQNHRENSGNFRWDLVVNVEKSNVWLSETLLMSPNPRVERNCFIARVVVDTATSSAILSSRDLSRPRILHARAFQCTGSFGESKTRSTPWKTCYRDIYQVYLGVAFASRIWSVYVFTSTLPLLRDAYVSCRPGPQTEWWWANFQPILEW